MKRMYKRFVETEVLHLVALASAYWVIFRNWNFINYDIRNWLVTWGIANFLPRELFWILLCLDERKNQHWFSGQIHGKSGTKYFNRSDVNQLLSFILPLHVFSFTQVCIFAFAYLVGFPDFISTETNWTWMKLFGVLMVFDGIVLCQKLMPIWMSLMEIANHFEYDVDADSESDSDSEEMEQKILPASGQTVLKVYSGYLCGATLAYAGLMFIVLGTMRYLQNVESGLYWDSRNWFQDNVVHLSAICPFFAALCHKLVFRDSGSILRFKQDPAINTSKYVPQKVTPCKVLIV